MADEGPGWSDLLGMGITCAGVLLAGIALGWLVDSLAATFPVFVFVGLVLGILGAATYFIVKFRSYLKS